MKYEIWELGNCKFATIDARDAEHALDIAESSYPRYRSDYNMGPDDPPITVEWCAHPVDGEGAKALRAVTVPSV